MWMICTLMTFFCWGTADLFYKIGNRGEENHNHIKTGIMVGLVMGVHAILYMILKQVSLNIMDLVKYLPVSLFYISSMVIGYKGLKYLELSISSPIQNTSGVITAILLMIFFQETYTLPFYIAGILIFIGIMILSLEEVKEGKEKRKQFQKKNTMKKVITLTILFPLAYCVLDGAGTFLDGIYLDKLSLIGEDQALLAYEFTFAIFAGISYLILRSKKEEFHIIKEKPKLWAALFETGGQFFYVYAMSGNATISAPIVGSYCVLSLLLSRLFLKEKLKTIEYLGILLVLIGIIILVFLDI